MQELNQEPLSYTFNHMPDVGKDKWEYGFATAVVWALETKLLSRNTFVEMINSPDFKTAADCLTGTDYGFAASAVSFAEIEAGLLESRSDVRKLFSDLIDNDDYRELFKSSTDFANLRLAIRRLVTEKAIGVDYSDDGNVAAHKFEEVLEQENYAEFPLFLQEAVELAVLKYYDNKDIRQIDYGIDQYSCEYFAEKAASIDDEFLVELFRMMSDLNDIRTLFRLKFRESEQKDHFCGCGYLDKSRMIHCLEIGYEGLAAMFSATPYHHIIEAGANYLVKNNSFLKLEQMCNSHLMTYLKSTYRIAAGPQSIVAYMLRKEMEIRTVRMILVGKKNSLEPAVLLDGLYTEE
jgi:V/A-type H+-transporting ATPase subunit C